jgi:hypothetical protein
MSSTDIIVGSDKKTNSQGTVPWPDHISDKTLERMGLAIIEGSECEQVLQHYRINVWIKAMGVISKMAPLIASEALKVHFRKLKKRYESAALEMLNQIPLAAAPSLLLLQSLMSAVCSLPSLTLTDIELTITDTLDAVSRKYVTLLDVHGIGFTGHRLSQLPQHH